jgi:hypothetical protein
VLRVHLVVSVTIIDKVVAVFLGKIASRDRQMLIDAVLNLCRES